MRREISSHIIVIENNWHHLIGFPLEQYWVENNNRPNLCSWTSEAFYQGYYSHWLIKEDKLWLTEYFSHSNMLGHNEKLYLEDIFPNSEKPVFAEWFTGNIGIQVGKILSSSHHFGNLLEHSITFDIRKGELIDINMSDNTSTIGII